MPKQSIGTVFHQPFRIEPISRMSLLKVPSFDFSYTFMKKQAERKGSVIRANKE